MNNQDFGVWLKAYARTDKDIIEKVAEIFAQTTALKTAWPDTYAAYCGVFATPLACRQIDNDYAKDARKRMRDFDDLMKRGV
jgi:hypothetical protein